MKSENRTPPVPQLPVPFVPPPAELRGLVAAGLDPTEATILLAHQLGFPQNYLAKAFGVSSTRVKTALDKATAFGFGRLPRRDLLKRRPIDEVKREKILEEGNKPLDRLYRLERRIRRLPGAWHPRKVGRVCPAPGIAKLARIHSPRPVKVRAP